MKRLMISFVAVFLLASVSYAADYTVSTTAPQDKALSAIVARENALRAQVKPLPLPALTNQQYLSLILKDVFGSYVRQVTDQDVDKLDLSIKWQGLTDAQKNQIKAILGVP